MEEMGFCVHKIGPKRSPKVKFAMALCVSQNTFHEVYKLCAKFRTFIK